MSAVDDLAANAPSKLDRNVLSALQLLAQAIDDAGGGGTGTATAVAGAATLNQPAGTITSETLVAASTYTLTLSNSLIKSASVVIVDAVTSTGASSAALLDAKAVTDGQLVVTFVLGPALTGTVAIDFAVFN